MAAACLSELLNGFSTADIFDMLEYPADRKLGDIALPCFKLSKAMRMPPQKIAESLCAGLKASEECANVFEKIENVNGYLNFYISNDYLFLLGHILLHNI